MPLLPTSQRSLLVRTTAVDDAAWHRLVAVLGEENEDGFRAYVDFVDDPMWVGAPRDLLRNSIPQHPRETAVLFIADDETLSAPDFPIVVVDLLEQRPAFRCVASELWAVENNLNIANMDWEEFADSTDQNGVYRGPNER
ncbi:hypothetical protein [Microbacterium sp. SS28]|uniref:DUF6924 domain-containing protein n=1 Tax=Microbacterium sp. SS28 TaxID=2919948 RepID=UPI001FA956BE|nr:hypothetical protein [Microbacterium sp. SS28]